MLRLLLHLWKLQQRRNFKWKDLFVGIYIVFLYIVFGVSFYMGAKESGTELFEEGVSSTVGAGIVIGMLIPDIILKMVMKKDATAMDDYFKARPVPERLWNTFLLLRNLLSVWNLVLPILLLPILVLILPSLWQVVGTFLLLLIYSEINGLCITCYHKTSRWTYRLPLIMGWITMFVVLLLHLLFLGSLWNVTWLLCGMLFWALVFVTILVRYLNYLKIYDEAQYKVNKTHSLGKVSLFSIQYIGTLRAKRLRNMVLLIAGIFIFDAYFMILIANDEHPIEFGAVLLYTLGIILFPSLVFSQWTLGVEANYFQGLMTKPVTIRQILTNCYYFYVIVSLVASIFVIPLPFLANEVSLLTLIMGWCLALFINLFNLPTCLFSSRLEIFNTSMFSMQGANMKINLYAIAFLLPLVALYLIYYIGGYMPLFYASVTLGLISLCIHKWIIGKIAEIFYQRRYQRMETFMEK